MEEKVVKIINEMAEYLNVSQMKKLQEVLLKTFSEQEAMKTELSNIDYLQLFLDAKKIEGCSERTIHYYQTTIDKMFTYIETPIRKISTEEIRRYLVDYQQINNCSKVTVDNVRRNISSFFSWLEEEDYILKSPMRRIHKIRTPKVVKQTISDEGIELLRDNCNELRDLAIVDLLYSTGIRVGELVNLNIEDIDFEQRECIVIGKGNKERFVYFGSACRKAIDVYLPERNKRILTDNRALFGSRDNNRISVTAVHRLVKKALLQAGLDSTQFSAHKLRHTAATMMLSGGVDVKTVQEVLGHENLNTTQIYTHIENTELKLAAEANPLSKLDFSE